MQLTYILAPLALASIAASWNLDLYGKDKRHVNFHGKKNTGCNTITFRPSLNVVRAKFDPATKLLPDPKTFELYSGASCNGLSYRSGKGDHKLTPRVIRSYKVLGGVGKRVRREEDIDELEVDDVEGIEARATAEEESDEAVEIDYEA